MGYWKKKPFIVEARQFTEESSADVASWLMEAGRSGRRFGDSLEIVEPGKPTMRADLGDWVIKGLAGEFYPCSDEVFQKTYEEV